jgi:alpha-L-fucosidase 2
MCLQEALQSLCPPSSTITEPYGGLTETTQKSFMVCRGIYIPAGTTPGIGAPNQIVPVIMNWTGCGWLAQHYYNYYLFSGDIEF